jgi:hypothetical protein
MPRFHALVLLLAYGLLLANFSMPIHAQCTSPVAGLTGVASDDLNGATPVIGCNAHIFDADTTSGQYYLADNVEAGPVLWGQNIASASYLNTTYSFYGDVTDFTNMVVTLTVASPCGDILFTRVCTQVNTSTLNICANDCGGNCNIAEYHCSGFATAALTTGDQVRVQVAHPTSTAEVKLYKIMIQTTDAQTTIPSFTTVSPLVSGTCPASLATIAEQAESCSQSQSASASASQSIDPSIPAGMCDDQFTAVLAGATTNFIVDGDGFLRTGLTGTGGLMWIVWFAPSLFFPAGMDNTAAATMEASFVVTGLPGVNGRNIDADLVRVDTEAAVSCSGSDVGDFVPGGSPLGFTGYVRCINVANVPTVPYYFRIKVQTSQAAEPNFQLKFTSVNITQSGTTYDLVACALPGACLNTTGFDIPVTQESVLSPLW